MLVGYCAQSEYYMGVIYAQEWSFSLGYAYWFMPIASVFPVCFIHRYLSRESLSRLITFRGTRAKYILSNIFTAFVAGMIVMGAAYLIFGIISFFQCWPDTVTYKELTEVLSYVETENGPIPWDTAEAEIEAGYFYVLLNEDCGWLTAFPFFYNHRFLYYLFRCVCIMLQGGMYSMISLACLGISRNQYISLAFPFLFQVLLAYLGTTLEIYWLDPGQLDLNGIMSWQGDGGVPYFAAYILIVFCLSSAIWIVYEYKRLK